MLRPRRGPGGSNHSVRVNTNALKALPFPAVFFVFVASVQPLMEEIKATPNHNVGNPPFNAKGQAELKTNTRPTADPESPSIERRIANVMISFALKSG